MCLFPFVREVGQAIEALHRLGYAHQDLRLENVCFSEQIRAVLINLDSMCTLEHKPEFHNNAMYKCDFSAEQNDWLQLGLIISWVTGDYTCFNYYSTERQHLPQRHAEDRFFCALMDGRFVERFLRTSGLHSRNMSLDRVLERRHEH